MATYRLFDETIYAPRLLDSKGRCCGRKPLVYKLDPDARRLVAEARRVLSMALEVESER